MKYELQKLLTNRYVLFLLAAAILLNGILFYQYCEDNSKGYTLTQIAQKYEMADGLEDELGRLEQQIWAFDSDAEQESLLTGNIYQEFNLDTEVLDRISAAEGYEEFLQSTCQEALCKLRTGLFGAEDSFAVRSLEKTVEVYQSLAAVEVESSFSGGAETLFHAPLTDPFLVLFGCAAGLLLITAERDSGYLALLRPMKKGRSSLYWRKFGVMVAVVFSGAVLLYGTDAAIAQILLDLGHLSRSIQSVYGFQGCPYALSVGEALLVFGGMKILWLVAVSSFFFLLCCILNRPAMVLSVFSLSMGASFLMQRSSSLLLRSMNLLSGSDTDAVLANCLYVNLFEFPVDRLAVVAVFYTLLLAAASLTGLAVFCGRSAVLAQRRKAAQKRFHTGRHTNLFAHECYKVFIISGGLVMLAGLAAVQFLSYRDFYIRRDAQEHYYQFYSEILSGQPSREKDSYLMSESQRFEELWEKYNWYVEQVGSNDPAFELLTRDLTDKLQAQKGFQLSMFQYKELQPGQSYVYATGWERLYGGDGISDDLVNCAKLFFVLAVALSGIFSAEYETGVAAIQVTARKTRAVSKAKWISAVCLLLIALSIAFLPQYWVVASGYYLDQLSAQANSLTIFFGLPAFVTLWEVLMITTVVRLCLGVFAVWLIFFFSRRIKDTLIAMLLSLSVLLLPILIGLVL